MKIQTFSDGLSDPPQTILTPFPYQTSKHGTLTGIGPLFERGTMSFKGKELKSLQRQYEQGKKFCQENFVRKGREFWQEGISFTGIYRIPETSLLAA
jgi:hypothetical protein